MSDFFDGIDDALAKQRKADAEALDTAKFDPEPGETLHGVFLKAEPFTKGKFGSTVIITFRNVGDTEVGGVEPRDTAVMFTPTVLRRKLLEAQPAMGTPFALTYEGKVQPEKGGNPYKDYTLLTAYMKDGQADQVDEELWGRIHIVLDLHDASPRSGRTQESDSGWKF